MNQVAKLDLAQIRQQAINDGLLVDQSSIGKQAGFLTNVAVTPAIVGKRQVTAACDSSPGIASLELRLI